MLASDSKKCYIFATNAQCAFCKNAKLHISNHIVALCEIKGGGHRVPPAGLPIGQVFGEYSLSFLRRDVALFVSTRARDSF